MRTSMKAVVVLTCAIWGGLSTGCASLDDYRQVQMANRKLTEEKEALERDLQDARTVADQMRERVTSLERELLATTDLASNLRGENERLQKAFDEAQRQVGMLADRDPAKPIVIERALPPGLDSALKDFAAKYPGVVDYDEKTGVVKWKSDLLFALGSDIVRDDVKEPLGQFAEIVKSSDASGFDVVIVGHTDTTPIRKATTRQEHKTNWHLSAHRSISVMDILASAGVSQGRLGVMGYGEFRPIAENSSNDGKAQNRRVEMYLVPANKLATVATGPRGERKVEVVAVEEE